MENEIKDTRTQLTSNTPGSGVSAKIAAVLEIITGAVFALMSLYGFITKTEGRDLLASFWMLLLGAAFIVAGIFLFRLKRWAWIASMIFYGGGIIFLTADSLIEHFGHGVVMSVAFHAGIIPSAVMAVLLALSFRAVFMRDARDFVSERKNILALLLSLSIVAASFACSQTYTVNGSSMEPTLTAGEIVREIPVPDNGVPRGHLVAYRPPHREDGVIYIHRCVAVEGDTFSIQNGHVYLNNIITIEKYTAGRKTLKHLSNISIEGVVPRNTIVVLGDNRENAQDSRYFGYLPVKNIVGLIEKIAR